MDNNIVILFDFLNAYASPVIGKDISFEYLSHSFVEGKFYMIHLNPFQIDGETYSKLRISESTIKDCEHAMEYMNEEEQHSLTELILQLFQQ